MRTGIAGDIAFQTILLLLVAAFFVNGVLLTTAFVLAFMLVDVTVLAHRTRSRHPHW
jgi:hypothetical protein